MADQDTKPVAPVIPKRRFRLVAGTWTTPGKEGKSYHKGQVVEHTLDLCKLFVGQFVEVTENNVPVQHAAPAVVPAANAPEDQGGLETQQQHKTDVGAFGANVTEKFPDAAANGLSVFHDGHKYNVTDATDPAASINGATEEELTSITATKAWITKFAAK